MTSKQREEEEQEVLLGRQLGSHTSRLDEVSRTMTEEKARQEDETKHINKATWQNLPHKKQLFLIALCRLSAPLTNTCLIPYLFFLVKSILSEPENPATLQRISRLTGLLVAAFPIGQMITSMLWGRLSDIYGRKPAILLGLAISVVANVAFGFSRTISMLVVWRILAGMANGIEGVMRTMTAEIVKDQKHQPRAFLAPPVVFNSGRVIALAVGGCLASPVDNLPYLFGSGGLFNAAKRPDGVRWTRDYPYALPALFNAVVLAVCLVVAAIWLRESLSTKDNPPNSGVMVALSRTFRHNILCQSFNKYALLQGDDESLAKSASSTDGSSTPSGQPTNTPALSTRQVRHALITFTLLPLHNATFLHIFPILLSMPIVPDQKSSVFFFKGGLGLASPTIGLWLALFGIGGIILQLFIYPRMHQRIGSLGMFQVASAIFPMAYLAAPYLVLLKDQGPAKWTAMAMVLFAQVMPRTMAIPSSVLLLTEAAPRRNVLGTVHGAGNTVSAFASACGPAIGGVLLAKGIDVGVVGLVWWTWMCAVSIMTLMWSCVCFSRTRTSLYSSKARSM
jgi:MFS family permease